MKLLPTLQLCTQPKEPSSLSCLLNLHHARKIPLPLPQFEAKKKNSAPPGPSLVPKFLPPEVPGNKATPGPSRKS